MSLKKVRYFSVFMFILSFSLLLVLQAAEDPNAETWQDKALKKAQQIPDLRLRHEVMNNIKVGNISSDEQLESIVDKVESDLIPPVDSNLEGLKDEALKNELYNKVKDHKSLGYNGARKVMYSVIDNIKIDSTHNIIYCVYSRKTYNSGDKQRTDGKAECLVNDEEDAEDSVLEEEGQYRALVGKELALSPKGQEDGFLNCEHTWPQSQFNKKEPMRSDLHHMFSTDSVVNAIRSHYAFGYAQNPIWQRYGCRLGSDAEGRDIFEPRDDHKGNVARAMFYFSVRYKMPIRDYEEKALKEWNKKDPVDNNERKRNNEIEKVQKNRNPFIDNPELADSISDF